MARMIIDQEQLQVSTTVEAEAFGGSINNPMAINIHTQPLQYGFFTNIRMDTHAKMDIDTWIYGMSRVSDLAKSHSSGGQPPSLGDVRQMVVSEPSGSTQMSSDGQPPSVNDVGRREPSLSEASCNHYEGPDENEVQQVVSESNDAVYKRGAFGKSVEITTYSGYDGRTQDLISRFGLKVSQSFGFPHMTFSSINDPTINYGGVWAPPTQPHQGKGTFTKVYKSGSLGRAVDSSAYSSYYELIQDLACMFGIEGLLEDPLRSGWQLTFVDREKDLRLLGDDPWQEFVNCVWFIKILPTQEVQQISLHGDFGGNSVLANQACSSLVGDQCKGRLLNFF